MLLLALAQLAVADPYRFDDVRLGASFTRLAHDLDFRDIQAAIAARQGEPAAKPDLGRRGYGCARRDDVYADVTCVSHDERVGGAQTREIRLQFLDGILQQFSITAEIRHYDAVMLALRERHGAPQLTEPAPPGGYASSTWRNAESRITAYAGKDLVFVSFELAGYAAAVKRRQDGGQPQECR
ncbi:MAG: hypothetical protein ACRENC_14250 [Gemmatimonadaceae bacterium]